MKNKSSRFGLSSRFIFWFLFVSLIPLTIIGYISYSNAQKALVEDSFSKLTSVNDAVESNIVTYFKEKSLKFEVIADNPIFEGDRKDLKLVNSELERVKQQQGQVYDLFIVDATGKIVASTDSKEVGLDKKDDPYFVNAKDKVYIKDIYHSATDGTVGFTLSAPLHKNLANTIFNGVIVGRYNLNGLNSILSGVTGLGKTGEVYLVDENSFRFTTSQYFSQDKVLKDKINSDGVQKCLNAGDKDITQVNKDYRGVTVLGTYGNNRIKKELGKNWCMVSEEDESEVSAPVIQLRNQIVTFGVIIAALILLLAFYASRSIGEFVRKPIRDAVEQLSSVAASLAASTQQSSATSQQVSSIAQQVASGGTQQSKQAEEISKAVAQMATAIQQMSASAQDVSSTSNKTSAMVQEASATAEESQKGLGSVKNVISDASNSVKSLAEKSQSIGDIVETITDIAEQTNMLALNAAIEAARAGEAGRGFTVVADEVRKLAESSAKAASQVKDVIKGMLATIDETVTAVESGSRTVDEGTKIINQTLQSVSGIASSIQQVSAKVGEVSAGIQQQSASVQQVAKTMDSIAAVAEQNASGAQQLSASAQQQSSANQTIAASAQQLQSLSDQLKSLAGSVKKEVKEKLAEVKKEVKPEA